MSSTAATLIECRIERPLNRAAGWFDWRAMTTFALALMAASLLSGVVAASLGRVLGIAVPPQAGSIVGALVVFPMSAMALRRYSDRASRRVLRELQGRLTAENLRESLQSAIPDLRASPDGTESKRIAEMLLREGFAGVVIRARLADEAALRPPLQVGFEPLSLEEAGTRQFREDEEAVAESEKRKRSSIQLWAVIAIGVVMFALLAVYLIFRFVTGTFSASDLTFFWPAAVIAVVALISRVRFLVVPGGVAVLRARVWQTSWTPALFTPRDSVLVSITYGKHLATLAAASPLRSECTLTSAPAAEYATRAFLSSQTPPQVEWLRNPA